MSTKQVLNHRLSVSLFALSFVVALAYLCLLAGAQSDQNTNAKNKASNNFQFEVVSLRASGIPNGGGGTGITPDGFKAAINLDSMIKLAYAPDDRQHTALSDPTKVVNLPTWGFWYQIDARVAENDMHAWQAQGKSQELLRSAMRALLQDRFRLALHQQQRAISVSTLVVGRKGIRFKPTALGSVVPPGYKFPDGGVSSLFDRNPNQPAHFYNATMADLIWVMENGNTHPIQDETGLTGRYDFTLYRVHTDDPNMRYEYLLNKLGLELKPGRGTGTDLIIDHIEKPSPN